MEAVFLIVAVLVIGAIVSGLVRGGIDSSYDNAVRERLANIQSQALSRLGLDIDEVNDVPPAMFHGYDFGLKYRGDYKEWLGADKQPRSNFYKAAVIFFGRNEMHVYTITFKVKGADAMEETEIFFYQDIVSVSTFPENIHIEVKRRTLDGKEEIDVYNMTTKAFRLTTKGGNSITVNLFNNSDAESTINGMRTLLRERKERPMVVAQPVTPVAPPPPVYNEPVSKRPAPKTYEPILGIETEALIKRALLFLEDGEFDNAGRYIEQALNQDAENPRVHFTKLMLEYKAASPVELMNKLPGAIENEKLFQRALRFASGEYKTQLEGLAQASRNKLEQAQAERDAEQAEREAEKERILAEQEADREKRYQEILNLKETASNIVDLQELLSKILFLRPYKDTNNLYNEVNQALKNETDYRSAIHLLESAKKSADFERAVNMLQSLGDYKEAPEYLDKARKAFTEAQQAERKKIIALGIVSIALIVGGAFWYKEYSAEQEAQRIQQEAENRRQAELQRKREEEQRAEARRQAELQRQRELERQAEARRQEEARRQSYESDYAKGVEYLNNKDYSQAVEIFRRLANEGYAPAQDKLAWMYQNGWGVGQSYTQAVSWFRKAAAQGNTEALASMGLMYLRGWGVTRDYDTALEWYGKAAAQGSEVARRRMNSIELLKANKAKIPSIERGIGFPVPGTIFAETLSVKQYPETNARRVKTLKTGHPVSVSRAVESDNDYWFYVRTASGTEGWVLGSYVKLIDRDLSYQERQNRRVSLPAVGRVTDISSELNVRNIPSVKGSTVVDKLNNGFYIEHVLEVFATENVDWYHVRYLNGGWTEGWVSGKYINITDSD